MAIDAFVEAYDKAVGGWDENGSNHKRVFYVHTTTPVDSSLVVAAYASTPKKNDAFSSLYPNLRCTSLDIHHKDSDPCYWEVIATYQDRITDADGSLLAITFGSRKVRRALQYTYALPESSSGVPLYNSGSPEDWPPRHTRERLVTNSAGFPYDDPIEEEYSNTIIRLRRVEHTTVPKTLLEFRDTLNYYSIVIGEFSIPSLAGKMNDIIIEPKVDEEGTLYFIVEYEIEVCSEDNWVYWAIDQGHEYNEGGTALEAPNEDNQITGRPILLNGLGGKLYPTYDPGDLTTPTFSPVYLPFYTLYPANWGLLGLPETLGVVAPNETTTV